MPQLDDKRPRELEIDTARGRRWRGLAGYVLGIIAVIAVFSLLFARLTGSLRVAVAVIAFMLLYMLFMAKITGKHLRDEDRFNPRR